jgi:CRP-like cAMP-binding protein
MRGIMNKNIKLIENLTLIKMLSYEEVNRNLRIGKFKIVSYEKDTVVHFDGEKCLKLEIIISGKVVVERIDKEGNLLKVAEFLSDDILGGNLLFSKNPYYPMTVTTQSQTLILEIDKNVLFHLLSKKPNFLKIYLEFISDHAFLLGDKIKHYIKKTIRESIISYLKYESKKQKSNHIELKITKKALAEKMGVQRTSLSRELAKMRKEGLILFDVNSITLLKY